MNQRGRKSATKLAVIIPEHTRLQPPADLPAEQREIWIRMVAHKPMGWFTQDHLDMLRSYCRHVAYGNTIGRALDTVRVESLVDHERLRDYERLYRMHERETHAAGQWAMRMRLTHQALDKKIAARKILNNQTSAPPWQANG